MTSVSLICGAPEIFDRSAAAIAKAALNTSGLINDGDINIEIYTMKTA